jgi:hypothetical protein
VVFSVDFIGSLIHPPLGALNECLYEACVADDGIDNQRISPGVRDIVRVIVSFKGDGAV